MKKTISILLSVILIALTPLCVMAENNNSIDENRQKLILNIKSVGSFQNNSYSITKGDYSKDGYSYTVTYSVDNDSLSFSYRCKVDNYTDRITFKYDFKTNMVEANYIRTNPSKFCANNAKFLDSDYVTASSVRFYDQTGAEYGLVNGERLARNFANTAVPLINNFIFKKLDTTLNKIGFYSLSHNHTGGYATCKNKAICDICGNEYGDFGSHKTQIIGNKPATKYEKGYTGDTQCTVCGEIITYGSELPILEIEEATGRFSLLKNHIQTKGIEDDNGKSVSKNFSDNGIDYVTKISYFDLYGTFEFSLFSSDNDTLKLTLPENGGNNIRVTYQYDNSIYAYADIDCTKLSENSTIVFILTVNQLDISEYTIQNTCNSFLKLGFSSWDLLLFDLFSLDINMGDLGFIAYEEGGLHTWEETNILTPSTCLNSGTQLLTCKICGVQNYESIPPHGHSYKETKIQPTKVNAGFIGNKCIYCDSIQRTDKIIAPTGSVSTIKCKARTCSSETIIWSGINGVQGYQIQISTKDGKKWDKLYNAKTATNYSFKGLAVGCAYKYRIRIYAKGIDGKYYYGVWSKALISPTLPTGTSISKVVGASKAFSAQWKQNKTVNGYQVQYSLKSNFSGAKTLTVKSNKTLKTTVKKLSAKKVYYVRIRTYKTIAKVNYFSAWSKVVKVKTK